MLENGTGVSETPWIPPNCEPEERPLGHPILREHGVLREHWRYLPLSRRGCQFGKSNFGIRVEYLNQDCVF